MYKGNQFRVEATAGLYKLDQHTPVDKKCSLRFTNKGRDNVIQIRVYVEAYSRSGGNLLFTVGLQTSDEGGLPIGTYITNGFADVSFTATGWKTITLTGASVTPGSYYHIVVQYKSGTIDSANYVTLRTSTPVQSLYPYDSSVDIYATCFYYDTSWHNNASQPIYVIADDGLTYEGNPYHTTSNNIIAGPSSATELRYREKWVISGGTIRISAVGAVVKKNASASPADNLYYDICDSSMNVLRTGTLVANTTVTESYAWYDATLSSTLTLINGSTYYFVLKSPSSNQTTFYYQIAIPECTNSAVYTGLTWQGANSKVGYSINGGGAYTDYAYRDLTFRVTQVWTISGTIIDEESDPVQNVTVTYTGGGGGSTATDVNGLYTLNLEPGNNYVLTPSFNDWNFTPTTRSYTNLSADQSNQDYSMGPTSTWADSSFVYRKRITFGTSHDVIPVDYTFELPMVLGYQKKIADNGFFNESVQGSAGRGMAVQSNGNMWVVYHAENATTNKPEIWIVKYTVTTQTWGTPYYICDSGSSHDSHFYPSIMVDKNDYLHIAYGCHLTQLKYRKSNNTNPVSGSDWGSEVQPSGGTGATYPRLQCDDQNRIYIFFRKWDGTDNGQNGYIRSIDSGANWSSYVTLVDLTLTAPAAYCCGVLIQDNIIHFGISPLQSYDAANEAVGIGYIKGTINGDTGNITWTKVDGTSVTVPIDFVPGDSTLYPVVSTSSPFYGNNNDAMAINNNGYPYIPYHSGTFGAEVYPMMVYWNGSAWTIVNLGTSVTPNRGMFLEYQAGHLIINPGNNNIYFHALVKPPTAAGICTGTGTNYIELDSGASPLNDYYKGVYIRVQETGEKKKITSYVGSSRRAYIDTNWTTTPSVGDHYIVSPKWFGAELAEWKYNGSSWSFKFLTMNSSMGIGRLNSKIGYGNNTYGIVWARGHDILFLQEGDFGGMKPDGDDIRIFYKGTEYDRVANFFNYQDGRLYFKCQSQIVANKAFDQQGNYYVYYGKADATLPKNDPDNVFINHSGWELFGNLEGISGKDGWTGGGAVHSLIGEAYNKMADGQKSLYVTGAVNYKNIGTSLVNYEIEGWFIVDAGLSGRAYIGLKQGSNEFRIGRGGYNGYFEYYDTAWHNSSVPYYAAEMHQIRIIINSSGCTAYANGNLMISDNTVLTSFDDLRLGENIAAFIDHIIIKKWLSNPPEPVAGDEEFVGGGTNYYKTLTPSMGLSSGTVKIGSFYKTSSQNMGLIDTAVETMTFSRTSNQNIGLTDTIAETLIYFRTLSQNVGLSSLQTHLSNYIRSSNSNENLSSGLAKILTAFRTPVSNEGITSQESHQFAYIRGISSNEGLTSALIKLLTSIRSSSSNIALISGFSELGTFYRTGQDSLGLNSSSAKLGVFIRSLADNIGLTDILLKLLTAYRSAMDGEGTTSALNRVLNYARTVQGQIGIATAFSEVGLFYRTPQDNAGISDQTTRTFLKITDLFANVGISSTDLATVLFIRGTQANIGIADSFARQGTFLKNLSDSMGLNSLSGKTGLFYRDAQHTIGITDGMIVFLGKVIALTSPVGLTDSLTLISTYIRSSQNNVGLNSGITRVGTFFRSSADNIGLSSGVIAQLLLIYRDVFSNVGIADQMGKLVFFQRNPTENLGLLSSLSKIGTFYRSGQDGEGLSSLVGVLKFFEKSLSSNIGMNTVLVNVLTAQRNLYDNLNLSSGVTKTGTYIRTSQSEIALSTYLQSLFAFYRYLTDELGLSSQTAINVTYGVVWFGEILWTEQLKRILTLSKSTQRMSEEYKSILTHSDSPILLTEHYGGITLGSPMGIDQDEGTRLGTRGKVPGDSGTAVGTGGKNE